MLKLQCKCFSQSSMYRNFINYVYLKKNENYCSSVKYIYNLFFNLYGCVNKHLIVISV